VAADLGDVHDLLEGVVSCLAVLELDQVEHLVLPLEDPVAEVHDDARAVRCRQVRPGRLRPAGGGYRGRDVVGLAEGDPAEGLAGRCRGDLHGPSGGDGRAGSQQVEVDPSGVPGSRLGGRRLGGRRWGGRRSYLC
jgi:hypothetical protein